MNHKIVKDISLNAIFVALYISLVVLFPELSFGFGNGIISFRVAEILIVLCIFRKELFYGSLIACFVSNMLFGNVIDAFVGTFQEVLSIQALLLIKNKHLAILFSSLICGLIIGFELYFIINSKIGMFIILTTFIGEYVILEIGYLLISSSKQILKFLHN